MTKRLAIPLLLLVAALPGCGGDEQGEPIPAATRQELQKQLGSIEDRFNAGGGACGDITENQASVERTLDSLPADVDAEARDALNDGFARLFELVGEQCDDQTQTETETEPTPSTPPPTTTQEETPTTPPQTEEQPPEDEGGGNDKGKGNGNSGDDGGALQVPGDGSGGSAAPGDDG